MYVLSALELPDLPDAADLQDFRAGAYRVSLVMRAVFFVLTSSVFG